MATSEDVTGLSENKGELDEHFCAPCKDSGYVKEGRVFCVECGTHLCDRCLRDHNKFPALRAHRTADISDMRSQSESGSTEADEQVERCTVHPGQVLLRFCPDHDEVCCEACVTIKHRKCANVESITDAAKGAANSKETKEAEDTLNKVNREIQGEKKKRKENLLSLNEEKTQILFEIEEFQDKLIERIKEIANKSKKEVQAKYANCVKASDSEYIELQTLLSVTQQLSKKVSTGGHNDTEMFTKVNLAKKNVAAIGKTITDLSDKWRPHKIDYFLDKMTTDEALPLKSFGYFLGVNIPYHLMIERRINVRRQNDMQTCDINSICILEDGQYLLSDFTNDNLKRINTKYEITDSVQLSGSPTSVCVTGKNEVAVALRDKKLIQLVSCGKQLSPVASFTTEMKCPGLSFDSVCDELYATCGGARYGYKTSKVNVYTKDGTLMRSYETDESGSPLFSSPNNVLFASSIGVIFVADHENGLIALTKSGEKLWVYRNEKLKCAWGLRMLYGNQLLVTGWKSGNILQIGADGKEVGELVRTEGGQIRPYAVLFEKKRSLLMVGCNADTIRLYHISR